jgi:hypothetical protein
MSYAWKNYLLMASMVVLPHAVMAWQPPAALVNESIAPAVVSSKNPAGPSETSIPSDARVPKTVSEIGALDEARGEPEAVTKFDEALQDGPLVTSSTTWSDLLRAVMLTAIPDKYEDRKHWGGTVQMAKGIRFRQRGIHVQMEPRMTSVNDGMWHRYQIEFPRPEQNIRLAIENVSSRASGQFHCTIVVTATPKCLARFEHWVLGVKGLNFTIVSHATVKVVADCSLRVRTEFMKGNWLPDLILEPTVQKLDIKLVDIDTKRIGELRGDVAEELGDGSRAFVRRLLAEQAPRALKKINSAIAKKKNALRFSAGGKSAASSKKIKLKK